MLLSFICEILGLAILMIAAGALLGMGLAPFVVWGIWLEYKAACNERGKEATLEGFQGYQEWKKRQAEDKTNREARSWNE